MTVLCHTQKASFSPPSAAFQPSGPRRDGCRDSGGLLAASPGQLGLWELRRCQGKPRQTFPKLGGLGRDPGWRRACAPPAARRSQGSGEPGWSRTSIPRGSPNPCSRGSRGSGAVCLPSRLEVAARRRALRSPAIFAHGSLQEGLQEAASREGAERPEGGQEMGPKASFGETGGNNAPWPGGDPSGSRLQRAPWPGAQAAASWFCLWAEASAPAAAVARAQVSNPLLLSEPWASTLAPPGGGLGPWEIPAASRQRFPWGVGTSSKQAVALTSLWRGAGALLDGGGLCGGPEAPGKNLGFPASERHPFPASCGTQCASRLPLSRETKASWALLHLATLWTSVSLCSLGGRTRQRSGLGTHHGLTGSLNPPFPLLVPPPPPPQPDRNH